MKRAMIGIFSLLVIGSTLFPAQAQDRPPRPDDHRGGDRHDERGPGGGLDGGVGGGPDARPDGSRPPMSPEMRRFDMMRGYIDVVDRFSRLSRDPTTSGIAAVIAAADLLKARGADAGIEYFTKAMETTKNDAVKRAIRIQLAELYRNSGQQDKALEQLTELINSAPAGGGEQPGR